MTAPALLFQVVSTICARCDGPMVIKHDAIGRERQRCPDCDGVAQPRPRHPDDARIPQGLVRANALPPIEPGQLRCQVCARGVVGRVRLCERCRDAEKKRNVRRSLRKVRIPTGASRAGFRWQPKTCAEEGCTTVFQPTGPNARYCEAHR